MNGAHKNEWVYLLGLLLGLIYLLTGCVQTLSQIEPHNTIAKTSAAPKLTAATIDLTRPWLLIDTKADTLKVMKGNVPVETFSNIAMGSGGAGIKRYRGDHKTPVGVFRVGWLNDKSRFNLFFGLDYPNLQYAEQAHREGRIDGSTYSAIRHAIEVGRTPPQDTLLGGAIGIHGLGAGDPLVHANFNWTEGCIALDNQQIERLARWVHIGTQVEIR